MPTVRTLAKSTALGRFAHVHGVIAQVQVVRSNAELNVAGVQDVAITRVYSSVQSPRDSVRTLS